VPQLTITLVPAPDQVVVRITGDSDLSTAPLIAEALRQAAGLGTRQIVVDLSGARIWDCSGLHALVTFTADLATAGRSCRIVGAPARTRQLISAARLTDALQLDGPLSPRPGPTSPDRPVGASTAGLTAVPARRATSGTAVPSLRPRRAPALAVRRRG
jgi:anti-anti-sigma factor